MILLINLFSFCVPEIVALTDPQMMSKERFQKHLGFKLKLLKDTEKATSQWSRKPSEKDNAFPQQLDTLQESLPPFEIPLKGLLRKNVKIQNLRTLRIRINKVIRPILMRINGKLQNKTATSLLWIKSTTENVSESGSNSTKQTDPQEVASGINSTQNIVQVEVTNGRNSTQKIALADVTSKSETQPLELTETVVNTGKYIQVDIN